MIVPTPAIVSVDFVPIVVFTVLPREFTVSTVRGSWNT